MSSIDCRGETTWHACMHGWFHSWHGLAWPAAISGGTYQLTGELPWAVLVVRVLVVELVSAMVIRLVRLHF